MVVIESTLKFSFPAFGVVLKRGSNSFDRVDPGLLQKLAVYVQSGHVKIAGADEPRIVQRPDPPGADDGEPTTHDVVAEGQAAERPRKPAKKPKRTVPPDR